jgi:hypothetical protein
MIEAPIASAIALTDNLLHEIFDRWRVGPLHRRRRRGDAQPHERKRERRTKQGLAHLHLRDRPLHIIALHIVAYAPRRGNSLSVGGIRREGNIVSLSAPLEPMGYRVRAPCCRRLHRRGFPRTVRRHIRDSSWNFGGRRHHWCGRLRPELPLPPPDCSRPQLSWRACRPGRAQAARRRRRTSNTPPFPHHLRQVNSEDMA